VTQVCGSDPYCCTTSWDGVCVGEADTLCGAGCSVGCAHDKCIEGSALTIGCDPCVTDICAADPFCCNTLWDSACVNAVFFVCLEFCP